MVKNPHEVSASEESVVSKENRNLARDSVEYLNKKLESSLLREHPRKLLEKAAQETGKNLEELLDDSQKSRLDKFDKRKDEVVEIFEGVSGEANGFFGEDQEVFDVLGLELLEGVSPIDVQSTRDIKRLATELTFIFGQLNPEDVEHRDYVGKALKSMVAYNEAKKSMGDSPFVKASDVLTRARGMVEGIEIPGGDLDDLSKRAIFGCKDVLTSFKEGISMCEFYEQQFMEAAQFLDAEVAKGEKERIKEERTKRWGEIIKGFEEEKRQPLWPGRTEEQSI
jgi:hypothetical protein